MNKFLEIFEFLYYSIIFFIIIIFFSIIIDIISTKIFSKDNHKFIILEIFIIWTCLSILLFYSKKIIHYLPNPFSNKYIEDNNYEYLIYISLIPIIVSFSVKNMRNKTEMLYENIEHYF
jgi:hypothetical protein